MNPPTRRSIASHNLRTYFDTMSIRHVGCVNINTGSSLNHERRKFEVAYQLKKEGCIIATELKTKKGDRPDIVILDVTPPICYEILHTETPEQARAKAQRYLPLRVTFIKTEVT